MPREIGPTRVAPQPDVEVAERAMRSAQDIDFHNKGDYERWLAYGHEHGEMHGGEKHVEIGGEKHHVNHSQDCGPISGMDAVIGKVPR